MFNFLSNLNLKLNFSIIWFLFFFNFLPLTFLNFFTYLFFIIWILIYYFNIKTNENFFKFNSIFIYFSYLLSIILNRWFFFFILTKINYVFNLLYSNSIFFFSKFNFFNYKWNPLIKQYSYYGYFKSNQSRWNFSNSDELKHYKF